MSIEFEALVLEKIIHTGKWYKITSSCSNTLRFELHYFVRRNTCTKQLLNKEVRWDYFHVDFDNIPPIVTSDTTTKGSESRRECTYAGKKYSHLEVFPSNASGIIPTLKNQCVNCACTVSIWYRWGRYNFGGGYPF